MVPKIKALKRIFALLLCRPITVKFKPKIVDRYFKKIITQAEEYYDQRKPGRKLGSKNKSKRTK